MSFIKIADSNIETRPIVEVIDGKMCEKCNHLLNMLKSKDGKIVCDKCGHENSLIESEKSNEV